MLVASNARVVKVSAAESQLRTDSFAFDPASQGFAKDAETSFCSAGANSSLRLLAAASVASFARGTCELWALSVDGSDNAATLVSPTLGAASLIRLPLQLQHPPKRVFLTDGPSAVAVCSLASGAISCDCFCAWNAAPATSSSVVTLSATLGPPGCDPLSLLSVFALRPAAGVAVLAPVGSPSSCALRVVACCSADGKKDGAFIAEGQAWNVPRELFGLVSCICPFWRGGVCFADEKSGTLDPPSFTAFGIVKGEVRLYRGDIPLWRAASISAPESMCALSSFPFHLRSISPHHAQSRFAMEGRVLLAANGNSQAALHAVGFSDGVRKSKQLMLEEVSSAVLGDFSCSGEEELAIFCANGSSSVVSLHDFSSAATGPDETISEASREALQELATLVEAKTLAASDLFREEASIAAKKQDLIRRLQQALLLQSPADAALPQQPEEVQVVLRNFKKEDLGRIRPDVKMPLAIDSGLVWARLVSIGETCAVFSLQCRDQSDIGLAMNVLAGTISHTATAERSPLDPSLLSRAWGSLSAQSRLAAALEALALSDDQEIFSRLAAATTEVLAAISKPNN